jgi:hypothetical protein
MDLPLWACKCNESLVRGSCNYFVVTAVKLTSVVDGLVACICVCVCVCILIFVCMYINMCVCVYMYIYKKYHGLAAWSCKCSEIRVRGICNHFAVTADKEPSLINGLAVLFSVCLCVYIYINECVCIYIYIYV